MKTILRTDVGRIRKVNEDAAYADAGLSVVCDGMGGHQAGDVAANLAVDALTAALAKKKPSVRALIGAVTKANERVYQRAAQDNRLSGMGTTLTALWADPEQVLLAQVGDSRAYLLRGGELTQCTHDHSMVGELVRIGSITKEQARVHPHRNLITRSLGTEPRVEADIFEFTRKPGDRWLLCSDGLTAHIDDDEIKRILGGESLFDMADDLMKLALERGGTDNITLIILEDEGGGTA